MANLYVWVDDRNRDRLARTVGELARRHPQFRQFLTEGDGTQDVLNLVFPHGMPMEYHAANLSIENRPDDNGRGAGDRERNHQIVDAPVR